MVYLIGIHRAGAALSLPILESWGDIISDFQRSLLRSPWERQASAYVTCFPSQAMWTSLGYTYPSLPTGYWAPLAFAAGLPPSVVVADSAISHKGPSS